MGYMFQVGNCWTRFFFPQWHRTEYCLKKIEKTPWVLAKKALNISLISLNSLNISETSKYKPQNIWIFVERPNLKSIVSGAFPTLQDFFRATPTPISGLFVLHGSPQIPRDHTTLVRQNMNAFLWLPEIEPLVICPLLHCPTTMKTFVRFQSLQDKLSD